MERFTASLVTLAAIVISEIVVLALLEPLNPMSWRSKAILDVVVTVGVALPVSWVLAFRPLRNWMRERRRALDEAQAARRTADLLREASFALGQSLDPDTVLAALLAHLHALVPYERAEVVLIEGPGASFLRAISSGGDPAVLPAESRGSVETGDNALFREVLAGRGAVVVPDLDAADAPAPPADLRHGRSWMGVPLTVRETVIGVIVLSHPDPGVFTGDDAGIAETLAAQASVSVQNARLFKEAETARERLRTLSRRLVDLQERERYVVARELHDDAGQALASLRFSLQLFEAEAEGNPTVTARLQELKQTVDGVLESLHDLASDLRPASLDHLGLEAALREHVVRLGRRFGLEVHFRARGLEQRLPAAVETALYRAAQEALTNVVRHARARRVDVLVERREGRMIVVLEDDGLGFEPDRVETANRLGLVGMRERVEALGGSFAVESAPGAGTTVVLTVPCEDA